MCICKILIDPQMFDLKWVICLRVETHQYLKIIFIHEASRECVWLRSMILYICKKWEISLKTSIPITCTKIILQYNLIKEIIHQMRSDRHISPEFFFIYNRQQNSETNV